MTKEVYFDKYCRKCMHWHLSEDDSPCDECLEEGGNEDSHKPLYFTGEDDDEDDVT